MFGNNGKQISLTKKTIKINLVTLAIWIMLVSSDDCIFTYFTLEYWTIMYT